MIIFYVAIMLHVQISKFMDIGNSMFFTSSGQLARICVLFILPAMREKTFVRIIDIVPACKLIKILGPVVQSWFNINPGLKCNPLF